MPKIASWENQDDDYETFEKKKKTKPVEKKDHLFSKKKSARRTGVKK